MLQTSKAKELSQRISDYLLENGALTVGISTRETLADSPPSADITYLMENGLSAVTFTTALNKEGILPYLAKEDREGAYRPGPNISPDRLRDTAAEMIEAAGYRAFAPEHNLRYRTEVENWFNFMPPDISHRYLAVVSGAASFGWSGNVGVKGYGTAIQLGSVLTDAELEPTSPIPEDERFCSDCKACAGACPMGMFSSTEKMPVTLGGKEYTHAARITLARCFIGCGGATGLHKSRKWSSWSPGRFEVPENEAEIFKLLNRASRATQKRPATGSERPLTFGENSRAESDSTVEVKFVQTCALCQLVCTGEKEENLENLKTLRKSGCMIQYPDGSLKNMTGEEAEEEFNKMPAEHRALYC